MGIKENFQGLRRGLNNRLQDFINAPSAAWREVMAKNQLALETVIEEGNREFYVRTEMRLAKLAVDLKEENRQVQFSTEWGRNKAHSLLYRSIDDAIQNIDQIKEDRSKKMLSGVKSPEKINDIRIRSLLEAKKYWDTKLEEPNTPLEVTLLGIRRKAQFDGELKALGYKPQDQQP